MVKRENSACTALQAGTFYIAQGRVLLLEGQHAALLGLFLWLLDSGAFAKNLLSVIYARIYVACAYLRLSQEKAAAEQLAAALDLALPDNLYLPFVENFDFLEPLLWQVAAEGASTGRSSIPMSQAGASGADVVNGAGSSVIRQIEIILRLAAPWQKSMRRIRAGYDETTHSLLTQRERQLALMAAGGLQYKAIAEKLGIAPSTVKRAFATMYKKLGISGRDQLREYLTEHEL